MTAELFPQPCGVALSPLYFVNLEEFWLGPDVNTGFPQQREEALGKRPKLQRRTRLLHRAQAVRAEGGVSYTGSPRS